MSILKDEDFELYFKKKPNSWFFDIYSDVGLKDCQADMDTQAIIRRIRCDIYVLLFPYISQAMKYTTKESLEDNLHHHGIMKAIQTTYLSNQQCSVQEKVHTIS